MHDEYYKNRCENLKRNISEILEKEKKLRNDLARENRTDEIIRLEHEIKKCNEKIEEFEKQMEKFKEVKVFHRLLLLDFKDQVKLFKKISKKNNGGAFLIYGDKFYGHTFLVHYLIYNVCGLSYEPFVIDLNYYESIDEIWETIAGYTSLVSDENYEQIANAICQSLEAKPFMVIFKNIDNEWIDQINNGIWQVIIQEYRLEKRQNHIYIFFIDFDNTLKNNDYDFDKLFKDDNDIFHPVKLNELEKFKKEWLESWFYTCGDDLSDFDCCHDIEQILQNSNEGVPEKVFRKICKLFKCNYNGGVKLCLKNLHK